MANRIHRALSSRITAAANAAAAASTACAKLADLQREDMRDVYEKLGDHIRRDEEMHGEILTALNRQTETLGGIHAALLRELGERPTRTEVHRLIALHNGGSGG